MTLLKSRMKPVLAILATFTVISGCSTPAAKNEASTMTVTGEQKCMERAMYFESNRSSRDGMIAVGTVVINRVNSAQFPNTVCKVVGQKNQFASGIMSRPMNDSGLPLVRVAAAALMRGERHPSVQKARFFHTAGYSFPYDNMHYVLVAGGNAFYEKRKSNLVTQPVPPAPIEGLTPAL